MWSARYLLFLRQTGNRHTILEVCEFQFWQFRDCGGHIFPRKMPILAVSRLHLIDQSSIKHNSACFHIFLCVTKYHILKAVAIIPHYVKMKLSLEALT